MEKAALLGHFSLMGDRMGIKGVRQWKSWDDADAFQEAYEVLHYRWSIDTIDAVAMLVVVWLFG